MVPRRPYRREQQAPNLGLYRLVILAPYDADDRDAPPRCPGVTVLRRHLFVDGRASSCLPPPLLCPNVSIYGEYESGAAARCAFTHDTNGGRGRERNRGKRGRRGMRRGERKRKERERRKEGRKERRDEDVYIYIYM